MQTGPGTQEDGWNYRSSWTLGLTRRRVVKAVMMGLWVEGQGTLLPGYLLTVISVTQELVSEAWEEEVS